VGVAGDERRLDRDVHGGVAHAEHDDGLAAELLGVLPGVLVRVQLLSGEPLVPRKRRLGPARIPVMPVRDDQRVVRAFSATVTESTSWPAQAVVTSQPPPGANSMRSRDV